jgi:ribose transport system substrate-binding protein
LTLDAKKVPMMSLSRRMMLASPAAMVAARMASAQTVSQGLTTPTRFAPFIPAAPACSAPSGLAKRLVFAQDNRRDFMQGAARGMKLAAERREMAFDVLIADNNPSAMVAHVRQAIADGAGALVTAPIDVATLAPAVREFIARGGYVGSIVPPPAVTILNAPQLATGRVLGDAAAAYIRDRLGGQARVVLLTHDTNQFLAQRFVGIRAALKAVPGARIVADISPRTVDKVGGYATMKTVLLAHSRVDVVLGADTVVLGALAALREAGLARNDQFVGGIDGEPEAFAEMRAGGPFKGTVSLASPVFGFALAMFAADWLEGKSVPKGLDILPSLVTPQRIPQFERDSRNPAEVWDDPTRRQAYLRAYGNACADERQNFVDFAWSSEIAE